MGSGSLGCGSKMAKYLLFLFNIVFWIIGAVILGVGIWAKVDERALQLLNVATVDTESGQNLVHGAAVTLIIVGVVIFVTGFLGCWGALKENACFLLMYAVLVSIILFMQFIAGILAAVFQNQILGQLDKSLNDTVQNKYKPFEKADEYPNVITQSYDFVQKEFKCCGALSGPEEWLTSTWYKENNHTDIVVPDSCCPLVDKNADIPVPQNRTACQIAASNANLPNRDQYVWIQGCRPTLEDWVKSHLGILIGIAFGLAAVQVLGVLLACCLRKAIKAGYETV